MAQEVTLDAELYRLLVKEVKDYAIFMTDTEGRIASWNEGAQRVFGYREEEIIGQHASVLFTPEDVERGVPEFEMKKAEATGRAEDERWHMRRDGTRFWASGVSTALRGEGGTLLGYAKIARDMTEAKLFEADLREQTETVETVNRIGRMLSAELDLQKLVQAVTDAATELCGAHFGSFFYNVLDDRGASYMLYTLSGVPRAAFAHFPMPRATDLFGPTFRGEGTIRIEDVKRDARYGNNSPYYGMPEGHLPVTSYLAVPVISRTGEVLGGLFFGHPEAGIFTEREARIVEGLAAQTAVAMDNARLFETAHSARAQAEGAQRRSAFLAEASAVLASSLDYEPTLASVASLVVPHIADWCVIDMIEGDGKVRRVAAAHVDPAKMALTRELQERYPPLPGHPRGVMQVLRSGEPELYAELPDELLTASTHDAEHASMLRELGLKSVIVVPLTARGKMIGAITLVYGESGRTYDADDLSLAQDLARRAALAVDNARLYLESEIINRAKDEFLATLSHELRTPLTAVLGWAHLLRSGRIDKENSTQALETIERNARAQAQLIDDLLDVSRIITGKLRLEVREVEIPPVIEAAIEAVRPATEAKGIRLMTMLDLSAGPISGDPDRLQQIVWNLLSNAIKFTPRGGRVEVRLERVDSHVEVAVHDTGAGIKPEFLPHVFDRFRQADSTTTRTHGGLGLGLAIVRHLVELHGGTVHADSRGEGEGATFTIELPLRVVRRKSEDHPSHAAGRSTRKKSADDLIICEPQLAGLRVLVVDDEPDTLELLRMALTQCQAEVTPVSTAASALRAFEESRPDVLVSDIGMPDEDGYSLIRKVRALEDDNGRRIPAIALTAYAREEDRMRALLAGFQVHIAKPINPAEFVAVVASLAGRTGK
ncbi:MAG: ATP-binding protein [Pyrinomonadaceae bacterium]